MDRRIMGLETEFGVTCTFRGSRRLASDEVARYLFRKVVSWGRSSNVFLANGARLYLDVGSHPEYATPECDSVDQLIAHDRAGERVVQGLARDAEERLHEEGFDATVYVLKNNVDSQGNSYGCHENYLIRRRRELSSVTDPLLPFLISRQIVVGAGRLAVVGDRASYVVSQRADHIWDGTSSATTRSRPIINTRDEPHADAERFRRLHVIVGDSTMSQTTMRLKILATDLVLRAIESGSPMRDLTLENPIRAIRDISRDPTGRATVRITSGLALTAVDLQRAYQERAAEHARTSGLDQRPDYAAALDLWDRTLTAVENDRPEDVETEIDWIMKRAMLRRYADRHGLGPSDPRLQQIDLAWHDIHPDRGLFHILQRRGGAATVVDDASIARAEREPPQTTRAKLRGDFVRAAQQHRRDFTVDWVHLKLNDQAQRTVLCKDPFISVDERVEQLIESMERQAGRPAGGV